jgi:hypothetical protein
LQVVGEVLSVDAQQSVEEAQENATLNKIKNCRYFSGSPEEVLRKVPENIKYDKACAVVICSGSRISACEFFAYVGSGGRSVIFVWTSLPGYSAYCQDNTVTASYVKT